MFYSFFRLFIEAVSSRFGHIGALKCFEYNSRVLVKSPYSKGSLIGSARMNHQMLHNNVKLRKLTNEDIRRKGNTRVCIC